MIWLKIAAVILGFAVGSFGLWRKMREEYEEEKILQLSLFLAVVITVGSYLGVWGSVAGGLAVLLWWSRKNGWDFWEWLDVSSQTGMRVGVILALGWTALGVAGFMVVGVLISGWMERYYRRFKWYKSGRTGLVGLLLMIWLSVGEMAVAIQGRSGLYWGGLEISQWVGVWVLIFCVVAVYLRAGYKVWPKLK